jgi:hypothetical protein
VAIFNGVNPLGQELPIRRLREYYAGVAGPPELAVRDRDEEPFVPLLARFLETASRLSDRISPSL